MRFLLFRKMKVLRLPFILPHGRTIVSFFFSDHTDFRPGVATSKVPTAVLLRENGDFLSFGFDAKSEYFSGNNEVRGSY